MDNDFDKSIESFVKNGQDYLKASVNDSLKKVQATSKSLYDILGDSKFQNALLDWDDLNSIDFPQSVKISSLLNYGTIKLRLINEKTRSLKLPFLLSTNASAVLLDLGDKSVRVPVLFENLILRIILSTRLDLVRVSMIDKDYGMSFPIIPAIINPMFSNNIIYSQEDINKLLTELAKEVNELNKLFLGRFTDLDSYNEKAEIQMPYHFVFIDDFPNGFSAKALDDLFQLIENGTASRAGIKFFINYSEKNPLPRGYDISKFYKICSTITRDNKGNVNLSNWDIDLPSVATPLLDLDLVSKADEYIELINKFKPKTSNYNLDGWIEELKKEDRIWTGSTIEGINVPIGFLSPIKKFNFYMANDKDGNCNDYFALIAGRPGYGKTVLLHNIIINAAMKYSPQELCIYLADFAEGASFSIYRTLPHVKSLMLSNNKEYALRMLEDIVLEAKIRSDKYKKAQKQFGKQVTNLATYREITGDPLPRILFIMDEFHTLFLTTDNITIRAKEELCNGIRQWRKFGISIILCTQSINGVNFGSADNQITYRFALNLLEMDSKSVIRNDAAKHLMKKGQTIMNNTANGIEEMNIEFQSSFSPNYLDHVEYLAKLYENQTGKLHTPLICEDRSEADVSDNEELCHILFEEDINLDHFTCCVFVGQPDLLRKSHSRIRYRRQLNSNTLIFGDDYKSMIFNMMLQLAQVKILSHPDSRFYMLDCLNAGDPFYGALKDCNDISSNIKFGYSQSLEKFIDDIFAELESRKEAQKEAKMKEERIFLFIMNAQNCYPLKAMQGKFGLEQSEYAKKLVSILAEGTPLGIHCIIHSISYESLFKSSGILETKHFPLFENIILLKGADTSNLYLGGVRVSSPEEEGKIIILNSKLDGEEYEQCNVYSEYSGVQNNFITKYLVNKFEEYRYV